MSNLNIGILGAGNMAQEHIKVIKALNGITVSSILSRTPDKAEDLANRFNIASCHKSIEEFLKDDLDGIVIAVSADEILNVSKQLMHLGVPLLIEKPPGINLKEAKELKDLSRKFNTPNMVGLNRRFMSHFHSGIEIIENHGGLLGIFIEGHERIWKVKDTKEIKNWIYANSIHTIDLLRLFGGEPLKSYSLSSSSEGVGRDQFSASFMFKNNVIGSYISHWRSPGSWAVNLFGEGVTVRFSPLEQGFWTDQEFNTFPIKISKEDSEFKPGFYLQMKNFQELIINRKLNWPGQDIGGAYKSMKIAHNMNN